MSDEEFNGQILAEKLSKLNSSQQSIESLSRWCITHRKKAKLIVETWDKVFKYAPREQLVSFLYLANDILQNSRRKGSEFVNEFWKFLPAALKNVYANGDESGKKAASRLELLQVIWVMGVISPLLEFLMPCYQLLWALIKPLALVGSDANLGWRKCKEKEKKPLLLAK